MLNDIFPKMQGYGPVKFDRVVKQENLTQAVLTGTVEIAGADALSVMRAAEAGADLKIIGNAYVQPSVALVVNAERVQTEKDLEKPGITWATNSPLDFLYMAVVRPLENAGVDMSKVNTITIGGSSNRLRALIAGKVDAVPVHIDQALALTKNPKFKILIKPWQAWHEYLAEVWLVSSDWLSKPKNDRLAVDFLKSMMIAFRKANTDSAWYAAAYRTYCTNPEAKSASAEEVEQIRRIFADEIGSWPKDMGHSLSTYERLVPIWKKYGAVRGTANLQSLVNTKYSDQAIKELSAV